jgi:PIN domain nuclease of toxin-antitoxin system
MRVLLDTHTFLWFVEGDTLRLSPNVQALLQDQNTIITLSIASLWEIAIKSSTGKLTLSLPFAEYVQRYVVDTNVEILGILSTHTVRVSALPFHHRDPFDRLLIAQSLTENIHVVSRDAIFDAYVGVQRIW